MKISLRNLAMGAALVASCAVFAQEPTFKVTRNWAHFLTADQLGNLPSTEVRTGCGVNGKIYAINKATKDLYAIDAEGASVVRSNVSGTINIAADDAGNLLVSRGGWTAWKATDTQLSIIPASDIANGEMVDLDITLPEEGNESVYGDGGAYRSDVWGRICGNMLDETGAIYFITLQGTVKVAGVRIVNGEQDADYFEFLSDDLSGNLGDGSTAYPHFSSIEDQLDFDPAYNGFYAVRRGEKIQYINEDGEGASIALPTVEGFSYNGFPGGDCFWLGGEQYFVVPAKDVAGAVYRAGFIIMTAEGEVVYTEGFDDILGEATAGYGNGGAINCRVVDEYTCEIYTYQPNAAGTVASMTTFALPKPEPEGLNFKRNWAHFLTTTELGNNPSADLRTGCGVNGKVYAINKATKDLYAIDAEGASVVRNNVSGTINIAADDAGNLLVSRGGWTAWKATDTQLSIIPASDIANGEMVDLDITLPEDGNESVYGDGGAYRSDVWGRICGDMLDEENGAIYFITLQGTVKVAGVRIVNGEQDADYFEFLSDDLSGNLGDGSTAYPHFSSIEDQLDFDPAYNGFYAVRRGEKIQYINEDGEGASIALPAVEGFSYNGFPGGDCFWLDGQQYFVIPAKDVAGAVYRAGFIIMTAEGEVVYTEGFDDVIGDATAGYGNGGAINCRVVNDNTCEIYTYQPNAAGTVVSMTTVKFNKPVDPKPEYLLPETAYLVGDPNGWLEPSAFNAEDFAAYELKADGDMLKGSFEIAPAKAQFRFYSALEGWEANSWGVAEDDSNVKCKFTDNTYTATLVKGKGNMNFNWFGGKMDVAINRLTGEMTITAAPAAPEFFYRSNANDWGTTMPATIEGPDPAGLYTISVKVASAKANDEFKFATEDWKLSFGAGDDRNPVNNDVIASYENGQNFIWGEDVTNATLYLDVVPENNWSRAAELYVRWDVAPAAAEAGAFAYDLNATMDGNVATFTFKANAPAAMSTLILTDTETGAKEQLGMGMVKKGENKFTVDLAEEELEGTFNWAIQLYSMNNMNEAPVEIYSTSDLFTAWGRGSVVTLTDSEYDTFGYTVIGKPRGGAGVAVFNPAGELVGTQIYSTWPNGATANSCPNHGVQHQGNAWFPAWGDGSSGIYVVNPLDYTAEPEQIVKGERAGNGTFTYNDQKIFSSTPGIGFSGEGENTILWSYDEDIYSNEVIGSPIGEATELAVAPSVVCTWGSAALANHEVSFAGGKNGAWAAQRREGNNMVESCPGYLYFNNAGERLFNGVNAEEQVSCNGGIAMSDDETLLAVSGTEGIGLYMIDWAADGTPSLFFAGMIPVQKPEGANWWWGDVKFDAANNIHYYANARTTAWQDAGIYKVFALPGEIAATTNAKAANVIGFTSIISIEDAQAADAIYYNVNGVRVAADQLTTGVYVKVQGTKASKVLVK